MLPCYALHLSPSKKNYIRGREGKSYHEKKHVRHENVRLSHVHESHAQCMGVFNWLANVSYVQDSPGFVQVV